VKTQATESFGMSSGLNRLRKNAKCGAFGFSKASLRG
jgi:hypothetical protein